MDLKSKRVRVSSRRYLCFFFSNRSIRFDDTFYWRQCPRHWRLAHWSSNLRVPSPPLAIRRNNETVSVPFRRPLLFLSVRTYYLSILESVPDTWISLEILFFINRHRSLVPLAYIRINTRKWRYQPIPGRNIPIGIEPACFLTTFSATDFV